jgi:hypothetical protein
MSRPIRKSLCVKHSSHSSRWDMIVSPKVHTPVADVSKMITVRCAYGFVTFSTPAHGTVRAKLHGIRPVDAFVSTTFIEIK